MELLQFILDFLGNPLLVLTEIIRDYGIYIYLFLFLVIFVETGVVVMPFLPGDSLLFAAGALAASTGAMDPWVLGILLFIAAVLGDTVNYHIGRYIGPRVFEMNLRFINQQHLLKTQQFFQRHGGKTIIFARFVPFARTFAPFVAGIGKMSYSEFLKNNIIGGIAWVSVATFAGYFFGNIPFVKENFSLIILGVIIVSVVPMVIPVGMKFVKKILKK